MADDIAQKITVLPEITALAADTLLPVVEDPDGPGKKTKKAKASAINQNFIRTPAEIAAGVTPTILLFEPNDARRLNYKGDNSSDDTTAINDTISVLTEVVGGEFGGKATLPSGIGITSSQITLPNRISLRGQGNRATTLKAAAGHTGPYMFNAVSGTSSMFGSIVQDLAIDCNNVAGLGGILSDAWQENSGMRDVLINKFRTFGVKYQNGFGGAATSKLQDFELFGSNTATPTAGIRVDQISIVGGFSLTLLNGVFSGGGSSFKLPKGIDVANDSLRAINQHFEETVSGIFLDGVGNHVLIGCQGSATCTTVVEIASTFTGTVQMIGCRRNGATNFLKDNRSGGLGTITGFDHPNLLIGTSNTAILADNTCKAWCTFDGTGSDPITIVAGFNVTNVTKTGTGNYRINMTRAMSSANAVPFVSSNKPTSGTHYSTNQVGTATFDVKIFVSGTPSDANEVHARIDGN